MSAEEKLISKEMRSNYIVCSLLFPLAKFRTITSATQDCTCLGHLGRCRMSVCRMRPDVYLCVAAPGDQGNYIIRCCFTRETSPIYTSLLRGIYTMAKIALNYGFFTYKIFFSFQNSLD